MRLLRGSAWLGGLALALSLTSPIAARAGFPSPVVTYPDGGLVFAIGQPITIEWAGGDPEGTVAIDLIDVNMYQVVASVTPESQNSGRIEWALPTTLVCGRTYQFYIQDTQPAWTYGQPFKVECPPQSR